MKKLCIGFVVLLLTVGCSTQKELKLYQERTTEVGFDTFVTLVAYAPDDKTFNQYYDLLKTKFKHYNALFDKYNTYPDINNIKTINDNAGKNPVVVDPEIIEMLRLSEKYTELTNGYFDVTLGSVLEIWHDYQEQGTLANEQNKPGPTPDPIQLEKARLYTGWEYLEINDETRTVYLNHEQARLDVGAIAKGFATEKVAQALEEAGLNHGIVSGGGNIRTINTKPDGSPWRIGVQKPTSDVSDDNFDIFDITSSSSVVTSGDYQRYYIGENDQHYSHLINPKSGFPDSTLRSITVFTKDSGIADALSTALYVMPFEEANKFIEAYNVDNPDSKVDSFWISSLPSDWKQKDGYSYYMTDTLKHLSKKEKSAQ